MITTNGEALTELTRLLQSTIACPLLTTPELQAILDKYKRGTLWSASRLTQIGERVIPVLTSRNGHRYLAVAYTDIGTDQKTGTTEPTWSTSRDSRITDNHVIWQEDGPDWNAILWDFTAAAREGWLEKAAKSSTANDVQTDALRISSSQLFDHCIMMADKFPPAYVL